MTTDHTDIANQPHVIVHTRNGRTIAPCMADSGGKSIDRAYAIYDNRTDADANIYRFSLTGVSYFSVPAAALFDVKSTTTYSFVRKSD